MTKSYEYHADLEIDYKDVAIQPLKDTTVDDRNMFSREEIEELRDAASNACGWCILELLLNTGQRVRAIQTLRVKDVNPEEGIYYLNAKEDGLKGANKNGRKRPLLSAERPVYDWLQNHQDGPEDCPILSLSSVNRGTYDEKLSINNIRRRLERMSDTASVGKPPKPQQFPDYFVTVCKRDYDMDDATIKYLIGHGAGSNIMETTHQHLSDEDYTEGAEVSAGVRDEQRGLTPRFSRLVARERYGVSGQ